ncbi:MAG: orotate phosphoribosyltransferase [Elusimicrobia bacterium GWA2_56_46]|nr:MAG: orotate phosphoribosyltransferase [Elusimicrobia bacterium GWA2_56_46]OGR55148.1 MAG: orotate phosphoribosyltransferase [Elusimicrobia bacterium GWC2_56_31]HBB68354.1 orotate phosphoribosyltransferase [Elusimicrobiota bacterium]HBW23673.1 orotate phosphoribosyltransferase [Elusimicrobiota bacterium]
MSKLGKFDVVGLLQEHGAILNGHFQLPSGFHTQTYIQTSLLMQYPNLAQKVAKEMASKFSQEINVVISPSMGAVVIGQEVARVKKARSIFTERINGVMVLKRDFKIAEGERALIVDDVLNTGRLCSEAINLARGYGAKVIGVVAIVDRSTADLTLNVPVRGLISYPLQLFTPDNCPLCRQKMPLTMPGSTVHHVHQE